MQNPLSDHDVACVPFVISAGVQIAIVFRERRGGDDDAQTMPGGNHPRGEPQIDVVLVDVPRLEERGPTTESLAKPSRKRALMTPSAVPARPGRRAAP